MFHIEFGPPSVDCLCVCLRYVLRVRWGFKIPKSSNANRPFGTLLVHCWDWLAHVSTLR